MSKTPPRPDRTTGGDFAAQQQAIAKENEHARLAAGEPELAPPAQPDLTDTEPAFEHNGGIYMLNNPDVERLARNTAGYVARSGASFTLDELATELGVDPGALAPALSYCELHNLTMQINGKITAYAAVERGGRPR